LGQSDEVSRDWEERPLPDYEIKALTPETWDACAALLERHNGVFGCFWVDSKGQFNCVMRRTVP
jgi:hypothetical protein